MSNNGTLDESQLVPELGDMLTIISDIHKSTTGRIIYRDGAMIRIRPSHVSDRAVEFPLDPTTGLFQDSLGVQELIIHEKAKYPHYARQLGILPGEALEFYSKEGAPSEDPGIVQAILATDDQDAIQLEDGRILNFGFLGSQDPYTVIVPRSAPEDFASTENNTTEVGTVYAVEEIPYEELPEIELPAPLVEEIPTSERTYSDAVQREDMFVSMLLDIPTSRQKNPRILRRLYRTTDLLLALKNSMVVRDATGSVLADQAASYTPNRLSDLLSLQTNGSPVPALLPVADVKKVVYVDALPTEDGIYEDVDVRQDVASLAEAAASTAAFRGADQVGNPFLAYMDFLLARNLPAVVPHTQQPTHWVQVDQDVLRTKVPPAPVQGFPAELPPAVVAKGEVVELTPDFLGTVTDRTVRLLSATKIDNRRTGVAFQIAPADSGEVVDHVLLSADMLAGRGPTRSSVLLWDVMASDASRRQTGAFYAALMKRWTSQRVVGSLGEEEAALATVLGERIPTTLQFAERGVLTVLDGFGMRALELNETLVDVLVRALATGREAWDVGMAALRKRAITALGVETTPIPSPISEGNPLWTATVESQEDMAAMLATLKDREPSLYSTHAARTAYAMSLANGTLLDVWYAAAAAEPSEVANEAIVSAAKTYRAERRRLDRSTANARAAEAAISATPTINPCQHVYLLESIRSIHDEAKRFAVLQDFLSKYQGGVRGNWVICGSCEQNLICRHELMLLHEFLHPGRSVALHKTLLLEFSGPVFEGAYICKNCGQKIADLEFDTHLEFDDEGRPLVGRTVVAPTKKVEKEGKEDKEGKEGEEELAEETEEQDAYLLMDEMKQKDSAEYKGEDLQIFYLTRTVLEHCGITPIAELYERIISSVRNFMKEKVPSKEYYTLMQRKAEADKKPSRLLPYDILTSNTKIGIVGALVVLEIQTGDFAIPFPAHGCKLERGGWPLDAEGSGCLAYVTCAISGIVRNDEPWKLTTWQKETSPMSPKRQAAIANDIKHSLNLLLAIPGPTGKAPPPVTTITALYKDRLDEKRKALEGKDANENDINVSSDRIPAAFRPLPIIKVGREEESAVPNKSKLQQDVATGSLAEVKAYVAKRQQDVIQQTLQTFHKESLASARGLNILSETNPRSDAACCFHRLGAVALTGYGIHSLTENLGEARAAEMTLLEESARDLRRRDPTASSNGTHIYVPWSAPETRIVMPQADPSMYYKLFLKNCFRGENVGFAHEYGLDWVCRHCKYACPPELEFLTGSELGGLDGKKLQKAMEELETKRQELAIGSLEGQVSEENFHTLEDAIHTRKSVTPYIYPTAIPLAQSLESMRQQLLGAEMFPQALREWELLQDTMPRLQEMPTLSRRRQAFSEFATAHDQVLERLGTRMVELLGARPSEAMKEGIHKTLESLASVTASVEGAQGARNIVTFLLMPMEQVATGFKNEKPRVNKWFPKVARSHRDLLHTIWDAQNAVVTAGSVAIKELKDTHKKVVVGILRHLTKWMGPWVQWWIREFRPGVEFTGEELIYILRWSIGYAMLLAVSEDSPLYRGVTVDVRKVAMKFFQGFFVDALKFAHLYVEKTQMTPKEIQEALLARQELERAEFIRRFDVLDRDMRRVELIKKRLKIGDWAVGTMKNLFQYDADFFEFERGQRAAMGLPEFAGDVTGDMGGVKENPYGFMEFGTERVEVGVNDHRAAHDEDVF